MAHFSAPPPSSQLTPPTLLTLPPELRLKIYTLLLPTSKPYLIGRDRGPLPRLSLWKQPALLQTSSQLRLETSAFFFNSNTFIVSIHSLPEFASAVTWFINLGDRIAEIRDLQFSIGEAVLIDVVARSGRGVVFVDEGALRGRSKEILGVLNEGRGLKGRIETVLEEVRGGELTWRGVALLLRVVFRREAFGRAAWRAARRVEGLRGLDV